jgi:signal transduction histidine kinase
MDPIKKLLYFTQQISNGNVDAKVSIQGNDELAVAGKSLNQMADKIKQLESNRRLFIQASAHELRNPMTGIKGINAIIRRRLESNHVVGDVLHLLNTSEKEIDRLSTILKQILEAFKEQNIHSLELPYNLEFFNLTALIKKVIEYFKMGEQNATILLDIDDHNNIFMKGDKARLEDVLRNIVGNAIKYSLEEKEISVSLKMMGDSALLSVKDKGIGIPDHQLKNIFESFTRGENLGGNDPGGIGLGLYICRDIIAKHGGTIWAENNRDKGATFYIKLPLAGQE